MQYQVRQIKVSKENLGKRKRFIVYLKRLSGIIIISLVVASCSQKPAISPENIKASVKKRSKLLINAVRRKDSVPVFNKKDNKKEIRSFRFLGRRFREGILDKIKDSVRSLGAKKKKAER